MSEPQNVSGLMDQIHELKTHATAARTPVRPERAFSGAQHGSAT